MLESTLEVHKNGAYILLVDNKNFKNTFPANKGISDVVLFVNKEVKYKLQNQEYQKDINDLIYITNIQMLKLIKDVKEKYQKGFSKEYREMEAEKLLPEVIKYMKEFDLIREKQDTNEYIIMPMCFKFIGKYPKDFE